MCFKSLVSKLEQSRLVPFVRTFDVANHWKSIGEIIHCAKTYFLSFPRTVRVPVYHLAHRVRLRDKWTFPAEIQVRSKGALHITGDKLS